MNNTSKTSVFTEIEAGQCIELLRRHSVGRVAWQSADGPQILPVTYAHHNDAIVFRTSPYGILSELVQPCEVAFEVDALDHENRAGWSIVARGRAQAVAEPRDLVDLWTVDGLVPWAGGIRGLFIRIQISKITGRVVRAEADLGTTVSSAHSQDNAP